MSYIPKVRGGEGSTVPDSGALTLWAWPAEIALTLYGRWASDPLEAASSVHNVHQVRRDTFDGIAALRRPLTYLYRRLQLLGQPLHPKETSLLENTWRTLRSALPKWVH